MPARSTFRWPTIARSRARLPAGRRPRGVCHGPTRGSARRSRRAKERGLRVTAEATPHHFTLTEQACEGYDTNAKMNPPLREPADVAALRAALKEGGIECIGSDQRANGYDHKD